MLVFPRGGSHVTGASSGIGAGTAKMFAELGAKLAITGRNEENLKKTAEACEKLGGGKVMKLSDLNKF